MTDHELPITDLSSPVPVFDCRVLVATDSQTGMVRARVANLAGFQVEAGTEREALLAISRQFRDRVAQLHSAGETIPWIDPPDPPRPGESQRWIPVHL